MAQGGLSCVTSLRILTLDARHAYIPSIIRQLKPPYLTDLKEKIYYVKIDAMNSYAFERNEGQDELAQSLTTGLLATIRPRISILLWPEYDWHQPEASQLSSSRDVLLSDLVSLRDEGRLRIMYCNMDLWHEL